MAVRLNVVHSPAASPPAVPGVQGLPSVYFLHPSPTTLSKPSKPSPNEGRHRDHKCDNKPFYHPPGHLSLLNDRLFAPPRYIGQLVFTLRTRIGHKMAGVPEGAPALR